MDHKIRAATLAAELRQAQRAVTALQAENTQLRARLARLLSAASKVWSSSLVREELGGRLRELSDAMDEATAALGGNDER